ncbi:uncharacterized protein [Rutidosis leptorrhynchoides]|uniref:uncharacterized protein n=1 Tax=Rutidosis leptorrhynchoides TaxID=125765 RepID=UPI003A99DCFF
MACVSASTEMAEKISWYCALFMTLLLVLSCCDSSQNTNEFGSEGIIQTTTTKAMMNKVCDEIYVVKEGETLQTISEKCGDPFIVEENPHIHDPDDVFPGLVIKITPYKAR